MKNDIRLWHPATEPITSKEIYEYVVGQEFSNKLESVPIFYDYKTLFYKVFSGENGYILNKNQVLKKIKEFVLSQ